MSDPAAKPESPGPTPEEKQATAEKLALLQDQAAGFFAIWTLELGLEGGFFAALARHPEGIADEFLAREVGADRLYTEAFLKSAYSAGFVDHEAGRYRLSPGLAAPLLEPESPVYFGGTARFLASLSGPLAFLRTHLKDGERSWWDQFPPEVLDRLPGSTGTFYTRLLRKGLASVPGLPQRMGPGAVFVELACGRGEGLLRLARAFPSVEFIGVDLDEKNLERARAAAEAAGLSSRVRFVQAVLEKGPLPPADIVLMNLLFHEVVEKDSVLSQVRRSLRPGGYLLVSDFPFPDWPEIERLRTPAGRVMSGLQLLEALLDDQLIPPYHVLNWLRKKGFRDVEAVELAPIHVLVHGRN